MTNLASGGECRVPGLCIRRNGATERQGSPALPHRRICANNSGFSQILKAPDPVTPTFRTATLADLRLALDWAAAEGWNPGHDDAPAFHAADDRGFFVAEVGGAPVAFISVVNHAPDFAFLGLYICRPDHRGRGIGRALWDHALAHAGPRTVGLDGVAAQQAAYASAGFARAGASRRFAGRLDAAADPGIRAVTPGDLPALARLDRAACGYARPAFLAAWLTATGARTSVMLDDGSGFATIRRCREGCKIGPIVARDTDTALRLARAAAQLWPDDALFIDAAPGNAALASALQALDFKETFATARMYRGPAPSAGGTLQAIASMELG